MSFSKNIHLLIAFLLIFTTGCATLQSPAKETEYYALEYTPVDITGKEKLPVTLRVERFQISPLYNTDRIVFREKDFQRNQYNYHRWRSNPRDMITYYLTRDMALSQLFQGVFSSESLYPASYQVSGTVDEFYELDQDQWYAMLSLDIVLLRTDEPNVDHRIIFQHFYRAKTACDEKTPFALAEAMGKAMAAVSREIIMDIHGYISQKE